LEAAKRASGSAEAALQRERDELKQKLAAEQSEFKRRLDELEKTSSKGNKEVETLRIEIETRKRTEFELRAKLDAAKEATGYAEAALKEEISRREKNEQRLQGLSNRLTLENAERTQRLDQELTSLRHERDELKARLASEQQKAAETTRRIEDLEKDLKGTASEFENAKTELAKQTSERSRAEATLREQLETAWFTK